MYTKAGCQDTRLLFIMTDGQISKEKFLVYINDMLSSGWIPELFAKDELDTVLGKVRQAAKSEGIQDTPDELFKFFLDRVRKNLHIALCFSPVGVQFRIRARMFPGLINCTQIDWFHEWPRNALNDVALKFLREIEFPEGIPEAIAANMAEIHLSISEANVQFKIRERRHNYTTPTSFLELIKFYSNLLGKKRDKITDQITRLEIGLQTMKDTSEQVDGLKQLLVVKMQDVEVEKKNTDALIEKVGHESDEA